jgi:hypothetical protein
MEVGAPEKVADLIEVRNRQTGSSQGQHILFKATPAVTNYL